MKKFMILFVVGIFLTLCSCGNKNVEVEEATIDTTIAVTGFIGPLVDTAIIDTTVVEAIVVEKEFVELAE